MGFKNYKVEGNVRIGDKTVIVCKPESGYTLSLAARPALGRNESAGASPAGCIGACRPG